MVITKKDFLTIDEFSKKCGFSKQFVSQIENEIRLISKNLTEDSKNFN